jgi:hypothetical protein
VLSLQTLVDNRLVSFFSFLGQMESMHNLKIKLEGKEDVRERNPRTIPS